jgi:thiol-disulfide isomerase/thioredoxin
MRKPILPCVVLLAFLLPLDASAQAVDELAAEKKIVEYLKENVKPGERVVVSELNKIFKSEVENKVLSRLFNTFFKIPLFVAQYTASTKTPPTLDDISRQFNLKVEGEAGVLLSIIDSDPRIPKFIKRDPQTGAIVSVDIEAVKKDRRFGQILERTLTGWVGRDAPALSMSLLDGKTLQSEDLAGKSFLLYFWFTGCPPCVRIAPHLVELQKKYGKNDFTVVAVNADKFLELETTDDERAAYLRKTGINFPVGHLTRQIQEDYGNVNVYPTLFLVDAKRVVQKHYVNYQPLNVLMDDVGSILKK